MRVFKNHLYEPTPIVSLILVAFTAVMLSIFGVTPTLAQTTLQPGLIKVNDHIYQASGFGNTILVVTEEGNVIIDTSMANTARQHKQKLNSVNAGPVKYVIITHAHPDHLGGLRMWREAGTEVIAQKNQVEFLHYQTRLAGFMSLNSARQFPRFSAFLKPRYQRMKKRGWPGNYDARLDATILFDEKYEFELGGTKFVLYHTPGETYDQLSVWIPQYKAVHIADNFYDSFPNMYTLRGTKPRWALEWVNSINKVIKLEPEILVRGHGDPIVGKEKINKTLTRYRDAILYVHNETVRGMNEGKDVFTLMQEIKLPSELDFGESYGKVIWSIRGIYEGYAGWFDGKSSSLYYLRHEAVYPDVVKLAGGADVIAKIATEFIEKGEYVRALLLTDIAIKAEPDNSNVLNVRISALEKLRNRSNNSNEKGWLSSDINKLRENLK
jgi:alkyl sulfatase BDS1-like metallo-beta-lactamase superfamily hydrolase